MRPLSTRVRLALVMGTLVGVISTLVTLGGRFVAIEVMEERSSPTVDTSQPWQEALLQSLDQGPSEAIWSTIEAAFATLPAHIAVVALDSGGNLRTSYPEKWRDARSNWDGEALVLELDEQGGDTVLIHLLGGHQLEVQGKHQGYLFVFNEPPASEGSRITLQWVLVAGAGTLLGFVAAWFLAGVLTRPLRDLTNAAKQLTDGDHSARVVARGHDEIGALGAAFNELATALTESEESRRRLVSETAHELRTPLTRLRCQLEGVEDGLLVADGDWIVAMSADLRDLQKLVEDLQELALADSGQLELHQHAMDLLTALEALAESYRGQKHLTLSGPAKAHILADATRFRQIIGNLLDNAFAWSPVGSPVKVRWARVEEFWEISVTDQGPGLNEEQQKRVFDRLYRVEPSRARAHGGSGLGLAIVRRLAEAHGGTAGVRSEPGSGCRFWVRLPAAPSLATPRSLRGRNRRSGVQTTRAAAAGSWRENSRWRK